MATSKLLAVALTLNTKLTEAVLDAIKAGMDEAEVLAAVQKIAEMIENGEGN